MFKGILIGLLTSILLLLFVKILFYSEMQSNSTITANSNNEVSTRPSIQNGKTPERQLNTNIQMKQSNDSSERSIKSDESMRQQAETEKMIALDRKYAQMDRELSERILDLRQQLQNLPESLKERLSYIHDEVEVQRVSDETRREAERIQKQILETNEKLGLIRAKRELLPLGAIKGKQ